MGGGYKAKTNRAPASSYGKRAKGRKKVFYSKAAVSQSERVKWAYSRWLSARTRAQRAPHDRILAIAADSRRAEWQEEKHALQRLQDRERARATGQDGHEAQRHSA